MEIQPPPCPVCSHQQHIQVVDRTEAILTSTVVCRCLVCESRFTVVYELGAVDARDFLYLPQRITMNRFGSPIGPHYATQDRGDALRVYDTDPDHHLILTNGCSYLVGTDLSLQRLMAASERMRQEWDFLNPVGLPRP